MSGKGGMWSEELPKEVMDKEAFDTYQPWSEPLGCKTAVAKEGRTCVKWPLLSLQGPGQMIRKAPVWTRPRLKGSLPSRVVALGQRG